MSRIKVWGLTGSMRALSIKTKSSAADWTALLRYDCRDCSCITCMDPTNSFTAVTQQRNREAGKTEKGTNLIQGVTSRHSWNPLCYQTNPTRSHIAEGVPLREKWVTWVTDYQPLKSKSAVIYLVLVLGLDYVRHGDFEPVRRNNLNVWWWKHKDFMSENEISKTFRNFIS